MKSTLILMCVMFGAVGYARDKQHNGTKPVYQGHPVIESTPVPEVKDEVVTEVVSEEVKRELETALRDMMMISRGE